MMLPGPKRQLATLLSKLIYIYACSVECSQAQNMIELRRPARRTMEALEGRRSMQTASRASCGGRFRRARSTWPTRSLTRAALTCRPPWRNASRPWRPCCRHRLLLHTRCIDQHNGERIARCRILPEQACPGHPAASAGIEGSLRLQLQFRIFSWKRYKCKQLHYSVYNRMTRFVTGAAQFCNKVLRM